MGGGNSSPVKSQDQTTSKFCHQRKVRVSGSPLPSPNKNNRRLPDGSNTWQHSQQGVFDRRGLAEHTSVDDFSSEADFEKLVQPGALREDISVLLEHDDPNSRTKKRFARRVQHQQQWLGTGNNSDEGKGVKEEDGDNGSKAMGTEEEVMEATYKDRLNKNMTYHQQDIDLREFPAGKPSF